MNVKDSLNKYFDNFKNDKIIKDNNKSVGGSYVLQPIEPFNDFNPLTNNSKTECYHNVAHQI